MVIVPSRSGIESTANERASAPAGLVAVKTLTCQTPEIDPGRAAAETTVAVVPAESVTGRFNGVPGLALMLPVTGAGTVTPRPFRKIDTTEPAAAGFVQVFREPSLFSANAIGPPLYSWPPDIEQTADDGDVLSRNADGFLAITRRLAESS
jgi:hypothetical protein